MKRPSSGLLFYSVGILVVGFRDAFPLAVEFEQKQEVGEVDSPSPPLFKNPHNGYRLLYGKDINAELPPRSEYVITELGTSLLPIIDAMLIWGEEHITLFEKKYGSKK